VTYGFKAGRPSSACCDVLCCCCAVLQVFLVRETSELARRFSACLPYLLGQPRDARRLNAYAGRTRLPILRSRTLSTRFILQSRFSGPKQIFCCPRSHLFSILLPSPPAWLQSHNPPVRLAKDPHIQPDPISCLSALCTLPLLASSQPCAAPRHVRRSRYLLDAAPPLPAAA